MADCRAGFPDGGLDLILYAEGCSFPTGAILREGVGFREALEILATRAHLEMPKGGNWGGSAKEDPLSKPRLYELLLWAESQFHEFLNTSPLASEARDYLAQRGFTQETIKR